MLTERGEVTTRHVCSPTCIKEIPKKIVIVKLNLASQPFRNRTLPWTVAGVVTCVSLVALLLTVAESRQRNMQAEAVEKDVKSLREQRTALQAQASEVREAVPPDQLKTLEAAHLLVDRKRFSWSRLLADLEASLPPDVRVSRIRVDAVSRIGGQTRADLEVSVVGRTSQDVTRMINEMHSGGIFTVFPITESPLTGRGESGFEWALRVKYVQRAGAPSPRRNEDDAGASVAATRPEATLTSHTSNTEAR